MTPDIRGRALQLCIWFVLNVVMAPFVLLPYILVGLVVAWRTCPLSFPLGMNAVTVTLLWPWPVAAHVVSLLTGKYPRWTPWL